MPCSLRLLLLTCLSLILLAPATSFADGKTPTSIAGISLNKNFKEMKDRLDMDSALPLWGQPYLTRAKIKPTKGFKSGYVTYGNCARPGKVLRIKMKYKDGELQFAQQLAQRIAERFGKAVDFRGNSWGTASAYKWSVPLQKDVAVSLILMHSVSDDESYTKGNSIRLSIPEWIEQERDCYEKKHPEQKETKAFGPAELTEGWYVPQ